MSEEYNSKIRARLDQVSASYCVAKWKQVTLLLQSGLTHSCHHPPTHKVPLEELALDHSALHNTVHKKLQRKMMLEGKRPAECDFCWRVEDLGQVSDRVLKSGTDWAAGHIERLSVLPWNANVSPSYLEVSFSNLCNMACAYCGPISSSRWQKDIETYGAYPSSEHNMRTTPRIYRDEDNPYLKAFWKWFPEIYGELNTIRVTGGEPLLNEDTFKLLEYVIANPNTELRVAVNSNLNIIPRQIDRLVGLLEKLKGKVGEIFIFVSLDTYGEQAAYIRDGLNFSLFMSNLTRLCGLKHVKVSIMSTFNALSVPSYGQFLRMIAELKRSSSIVVDVPYLRYPEFMSVKVLDQDYAVEKIAGFVEQANSLGFADWEVRKLQWLLEWSKAPVDLKRQRDSRRDFYLFFSDFNRRRQKNFVAVFPELESFWKECSTIAQS